jgi:hypothetical protein
MDLVEGAPPPLPLPPPPPPAAVVSLATVQHYIQRLFVEYVERESAAVLAHLRDDSTSPPPAKRQRVLAAAATTTADHYQAVGAYVQAQFVLARAYGQAILEPALMSKIANLRVQATGKRLTQAPSEMHWQTWSEASIDTTVLGAWRVSQAVAAPLPAAHPLALLDQLARAHVRFDMPVTLRTDIGHATSVIKDLYSQAPLVGKATYRACHFLVFSPEDKSYMWVQLASRVDSPSSSPTKKGPQPKVRFVLSNSNSGASTPTSSSSSSAATALELYACPGIKVPAGPPVAIALNQPLTRLLHYLTTFDVVAQAEAIYGALCGIANVKKRVAEVLSEATAVAATGERKAAVQQLRVGLNRDGVLRAAVAAAAPDASMKGFFLFLVAAWSLALFAVDDAGVPDDYAAAWNVFKATGSSVPSRVTYVVSFAKLSTLLGIVQPSLPVDVRKQVDAFRTQARISLFPPLAHQDMATSMVHDTMLRFFRSMQEAFKRDATIKEATPTEYWVMLALVAQYISQQGGA